MNSARFALAATLVGATLVGGHVLAQSQPQNPPEPTPQAPQFKSVLAGKKFDPPFKGQADVEILQPVTKKDAKSNTVVTTIKVKNLASGPLARLTIDETWYDKGGAVVAGSKGVLKDMLRPGEIQTVTIETPYNAKMQSNNWNFSHANGTIKPKKVKSFDDADSAAKPAAKSSSSTKKKK